MISSPRGCLRGGCQVLSDLTILNQRIMPRCLTETKYLLYPYKIQCMGRLRTSSKSIRNYKQTQRQNKLYYNYSTTTTVTTKSKGSSDTPADPISEDHSSTLVHKATDGCWRKFFSCQLGRNITTRGDSVVLI